MSRRKPENERLGHGDGRAASAPVAVLPPSASEPHDYCPFPHASADPEWHPIAAEWFDSLFLSPHAALFARSDVATAALVAHLITEGLHTARPSAQLFETIFRQADNLLASAGARLRNRVDTVLPKSPEKSRGQVMREQITQQYTTGYNE